MIATNVAAVGGVEQEFLKIIDELPLLPSSDFFYLIDDNNHDIVVNQGVFVTTMKKVTCTTFLSLYFLITIAYKLSMDSSSVIIEKYGKWHRHNDTFENLQTIKITSRRRQNLRGLNLKASLVVTNNDTLHHLDDYL